MRDRTLTPGPSPKGEGGKAKTFFAVLVLATLVETSLFWWEERRAAKA